jgi:hypothetical protein
MPVEYLTTKFREFLGCSRDPLLSLMPALSAHYLVDSPPDRRFHMEYRFNHHPQEMTMLDNSIGSLQTLRRTLGR